ncbi:MAG: hypothetical protein GXX96_38675 [Planctomycetaceae bacterium]|nr:hypothetical protein [Planctomycetaceae bacterium]
MRSRRPGVIVWLLFVASCVLLAGSLYRYAWPGVHRFYEPSQVAARQEQSERENYRQGYRRQVDAMIALAVERVQTLGGQCDKQIWKYDEEFYEIDLSNWQGTDADLALLLPFRLFVEDNRLNDPDRFFELTLNSKTTDDSLAYVGELTNLESLKVAGTAVTDAGLQHLARLDQLRALSLSGTRVSDDSIDLLAQWESLNRLDVSSARITVEGIVRLLQQNPHVTVVFAGGSAGWRSVQFDENVDQAVLREIIDTGYFLDIAAVPPWFSNADLELVSRQRDVRRLALSGSAVTDAGLKYLNGLACLETLRLSDTAITGAGFQDVDGLESLTHLDLVSTKVGDAELAYLKKLPNLQDLALTGTKVTNEGLQHLSGISSLRKLGLHGTRVSFVAAKEWQKTMPAVTIYLEEGVLKATEPGASTSSADSLHGPVAARPARLLLEIVPEPLSGCERYAL